MELPKKFSLRGEKYSIETKPILDTEGAIGVTHFFQNRIEVQTTLEGDPIHRDKIEQTMWHEIAHVLMMAMDEDELNGNEKFINQLGSAMKEVFNSLK